jgi:uncharacterized protein involved in exopolysaccharide biosynthesis
MSRQDAGWPSSRWLPAARRQWPVILAVAVLAVLVAAIVQILTKPVYESRASLLVRFGREYAYRPEVGEGWNWTPSSLDTMVNTEVRILAADDLKRRVAEAIGPAVLYPQLADDQPSMLERLTAWARDALGAPGRPPRSALDEAAARLDRDLSITAAREADIIDLSYRNADPAVATRVLQLLLAEAQAKRRALYAEVDPEVIAAQLAGLRAGIAQAEAALLAFQQSNQLYDLEEQLAATAKERGDQGAAVAASGQQIAALQSAVAAVEDRLRKLLGDPGLYSAAEPEPVRQAEQRLLDREVADAALMAGAPDTSYLATLLRSEEERLRDQIEQLRNPRIQSLSADDQTAYRQLAADRNELRAALARLAVQRTDQQRRLDAASQRLATLQALKPRLDDLQNQLARARAAYDGFAAKAADRGATAELDRAGVDNLRVVEAAGPPASPAGSGASLRIAVAGLLGALAGCAIALWREQRGAARRERGMATAEPVSGAGRAGAA